MKKTAIQIGVLAIILMIVCTICRFAFFDIFSLYVLTDASGQNNFELEYEQPGIVECTEQALHPGYALIRLRALRPGDTLIYISFSEREERDVAYVKTDMLGTVFDMSTGNFTGDHAVLTAISLFFLLVSTIMLWNYRSAKGTAYYSYSTIYYAGFFFFALILGINLSYLTVMHLLNPAEYVMSTAVGRIESAGPMFMQFTMLPVVIFAFSMIISNIVLLRHERTRIKNLLGILTGVLLLIGEGIGLWLRVRPFSGSEWEYRIYSTIESVFATTFVYFECMLLGSVICGRKAARHVPSMDRDVIIILGCYFRPDGTLTPQLKGRADRALSFWNKQKKLTGKEAVFIPSGGQGNDEPVPEAEAIRRYLISRGIREDLIYPECRSANTYENMKFSKKIVDGLGPGAKAVFATTDYHVFRSGVWANLAGLKAEGIGAKIKWWYWPNAFMRECAGLLARRWRTELLLLAALVLLFGTLSMVLRY